MEITRINIYQSGAPFIVGFKSAHILRSKSDSIFIELVFDNGICGWGESAPRPYVTGETPESVIRLIKETASPILFHKKFSHADDIVETLDLVDEACHSKGIFQFNSGLGACDIALLDALAKSSQASLASLLGPILRHGIPYSVSVPVVPMAVIMQGFEVVKGMNLKHVKVIMNDDPDENYERVGCIRSLYGNSADIRLDANGNWTVQQALVNIDRLKEFGISAVEQPVAAHDLSGLKEIRKETGIPVVVDESMCSLKDARKIIDAEACDMLNIKISKCGGLLRSRAIADFAATRGIQCQIGSHVGETKVLHRAGESFALTTPNVVFYEGCSPLLFGSVISTPVGESGSNTAHGLGVSIDKEDLIPILSIG